MCHARNEQVKKRKFTENGIVIPFHKQVMLLIIGLAGLTIVFLFLKTVGVIFFDKTLVDEYSRLFMLISYVITFTASTIVFFPYWKTLFKGLGKWQNIVGGFIMGFVLIGFSIIYPKIINSFATMTDPDNQVAVIASVNQFPIFSFIVFGIIGPVLEELTYRVGMFAFLRRINKALAFIATILLFGLIHFNTKNVSSVNEWLNLVQYCFAGAILCLTFDMFGAGSSMIAHMVNNIYAVILIYISLVS